MMQAIGMMVAILLTIAGGWSAPGDPTHLQVATTGGSIISISLDALDEITVDNAFVVIKQSGASEMRLPIWYVANLTFNNGTAVVRHARPETSANAGVHIAQGASSVAINFKLSDAGMLRLSLYTTAGKLRRVVHSSHATRGEQSIRIDNAKGSATGSYIVHAALDNRPLFSKQIVITGGIR